MKELENLLKKVRSLKYWDLPIKVSPVPGGITNHNFKVLHGRDSFFVRLGVDIPVHGIHRFNELAASRAAHEAGISPEVVHAETGVLVLRFVEGWTLNAEQVREPDTMRSILGLLKKCHQEMLNHLPSAAMMFWVFQVIRGYAATLRAGNSRMIPALPRLLEINRELEQKTGQVDIVFCHNDLLSGNIIDDGSRLWLIDWDYAGFNSPLFDLANLASNNEFPEEQERTLLEDYFNEQVTNELWLSYEAMKCASLLREAIWSMVSEIHSGLEFDFVKYTDENLSRFEKAYSRFSENFSS